ncbi:hypothetical protein HanXRQr2_Chr04g0161551 [Helianthus annuus]|uniref:Uncharacterized protein n=1 Tax=Helianthus annuus TaxID=4232 RepID=A0A9K3J7F6_HELAN|nr:hypothetical protein HanXRQr2_Chr04g0161551 [Helianthus annuus]KAJ0588436.1 hypothetical protein HanIR_Chr04g0174631 [Helianthus annuus]
MTTSWTDVEDIALCEAWEEAMTNPPPRGQGGLWLRVQQIFAQLRDPDHNRIVDALSSRFRVVRLECERFDRYFKKVEREMSDLVEDDQKEVALINNRHDEGHEFKHVSEWEAIRIWFLDFFLLCFVYFFYVYV